MMDYFTGLIVREGKRSIKGMLKYVS